MLISDINAKEVKILRTRTDKLKLKNDKRKYNGDNFTWGMIALICIIYIAIVLFIGIVGLIAYQPIEGPIFIFEKMVESGLNALVVGFFVFAVSNAFSKISENTRKLEQLYEKK